MAGLAHRRELGLLQLDERRHVLVRVAVCRLNIE
jgi:hypothetical protein